MELIKRRKLVQGFLLLLFAGAPLVNLFRLDVTSHSFFLFGNRLWLKESYLFMVAFLTVVFMVLLVAKIFGRATCGWACPRNTILEMTNKHRVNKLLDFLQTSIYAALFALILTFYFVEPQTMLNELVNPTFNLFKVFYMILVFVMVADLFLVRHLFCKSLCPYGIFQFLVSDENTLTLSYNPGEKGCFNCSRCNKACFVGLNPREEDSRGCINCGNCVLACARVTAREKLPPYLSLRFGQTGILQWREPKTMILVAVNLVLVIILVGGLLNRNPLEMTLASLPERSVLIDTEGSFRTQVDLEVINGQGFTSKIQISQVGLPVPLVTFEPSLLELKPGQKGTVRVNIKGTREQLQAGTYSYNFVATSSGGHGIKAELKAVLFLQEGG